jgi:hypothetical protein
MSQPQETPFDKFNKLIITPLRDSGEEIGKLFPDSILFGSLLLYLVTQNLSMGVLSLFFLETSLIHKLVAFVYKGALGNDAIKSTKGMSDADIAKCRSGFKASRKEFERIFSADEPPSISVFFWGSLVAYISGANYSFAQVLTTMGQDWWPRIIFSSIGLILLTTLFILGRLNSCDSLSHAALAFSLGIIFGTIFYIVNRNLFGLEGLNFNGLPNLVDKSDTGSSIYVCAPPQN